MSRFGTEYHVGRASEVCAATGQPLNPGDPCVAALCEHPEDEGFERFDYSIDGWESAQRPEGLFSFWRTVVPEPNTRRRMFVDDEVLDELFDRLEPDERPQRRAFRFVIGLILMRKRRLKFIGRDHREDTTVWLLKRRGSLPEDPPVELVDPKLSDDDVRDLSAQLGEILQSEL